MWKFQDFSVIQILREINFEESISSTNAISAILGALNFVNLVNIASKKYKNKKGQNSWPLNVQKRHILILQIRQL